MKKVLLVVLLFVFSSTKSVEARIIINEIMQSNIDCVMDDLNEFPDSWLELYNNGYAPVALEGYRVGLKPDFEKAYILPSIRIKARKHILVYCDKVGEGMHTNFRIDSGKGALYLFSPDGTIIDELEVIAKQPAPNIAFGRESDNSSIWGYQVLPTPGDSNAGGISSVVMPEPIFSVPGAVFAEDTSFDLELSMPDELPDDAVIRYTLNGEEPTSTVGYNYTEPIKVDKNTVVRAKIFAENAIIRPSTTNSYIFLGRDFKVPVISIVTNDRYLYDDQEGIWSDALDLEGTPNYENNWRRPINIEYFDIDGEGASFNQLGETRSHGNFSRSFPLKSLVVYANKRFGTKRFDHTLWPKDKPDVTSAKSFLLRNGGGAFCRGYINDALAQRVMGRNTTTLDWQGYSPVVVFINGEYHAMYGLRERSDEDNIEANYDGLEDIDLVDYLDAEIYKSQGRFDLIPDSYSELLTFVRGKHTFEQWCDIIDVESYADLYILRSWICDYDFPGNNQILWKRQKGDDTRWRWLIKDCDNGIGLYGKYPYTYNYQKDFLMRYAGNPTRDVYRMYYNILDCPEFRDLFIDRTIARTGDFLNADTFICYLDELAQECNDEQEISHAKWSHIYDADGKAGIRSLGEDYNRKKEWIVGRQTVYADLFGEAMDLGQSVNVNIESQGDTFDDINLYYDDVKLTRPCFSGSDYVGRVIRLRVDGEAGIYWEVRVGYDEPVVYQGTSLYLPIENTDRINITMLNGSTSHISDAQKSCVYNLDRETGVVSVCGEDGAEISIYDINGRLIGRSSTSITLPVRGIYIVDGVASKSKIVW